MRAYFFGNMYLSSIQQGIQAAHCLANMFLQNTGERITIQTPQSAMLRDWAVNHKTMILLNGGDSEDLLSLWELMESQLEEEHYTDTWYPWAQFSESVGALNNAMTCVGIILPEKVYEAQKLSQINPNSGWFKKLSEWEYQLIMIMNSCGMAR